MSRFSPAYQRQKPFTLYDGVQAAAGALAAYDQTKRDRSIEDERLGREQNREAREGERHRTSMENERQADERYGEERDYGRGRDALSDYENYGYVRGAASSTPDDMPPPDVGLPQDGKGQAMQAELGMENPPESNMKVVGTGIRGDWNGQFLQADGATPIPGTRYFAMPRSGKMERERRGQDEVADMLAGSSRRTGFAGPEGSEGRTQEARIQARTGQYVNPVRGEGYGRGGGLTAGQSAAQRENAANFAYRSAIMQGLSHDEALQEVVKATGAYPDYNQTMDLSRDLSAPSDRIRGDYGIAAPGIQGTGEDFLSQGYTPNQVQQMLTTDRYGADGMGPPQPPVATGARADSLSSYLRGENKKAKDQEGFDLDRYLQSQQQRR